MATGSPPPSGPAPGRESRLTVPLWVPDLSKLADRRAADVPADAAGNVEAALRACFQSVGFRVLSSSSPSDPRAGGRARFGLIAERDLEPVLSSSRHLVAIWGLVGCGIVLGVVDAIVVGSVVVAVPWIGIFAAGAILLRVRVGGAYTSDVIVAVVRGTGNSPTGASAPVGVTWYGGRVRSEGVMGPWRGRVPVQVSSTIPVTAALDWIAREFRRRMGLPAELHAAS